MKKTLLLTTLLITLGSSAQELEWQWAKRGGGTKQSAYENEGGYNYDSEQIVDIAIDDDNNYYFLSFVTVQDTEYDGAEVTVYNQVDQTAGFTDIVLISTDCEGTLRWKQTIGGGYLDFSYKIVLDNNGGLYLGANVFNMSGGFPNTYQPPHFGPNNIMPVLEDNTGEPQEGYKTAALLKFNTNNGELAWRVMPQGDVTLALRFASINQVMIDDQGTLTTLIGFTAGTHLNGQVVVPDTYTSIYKYYIVKFDSGGNFMSALPLSLEGVLLEQYTDLRYDKNLQRYYLAGFRNNGGSSTLLGLSFNGVPFAEQAYILAFSNTGNEVWRKEVSSVSMFKDNRIYDIEIDDTSDIYITGKFVVDNNTPGVSIGDYQFPMDLDGNVLYFMKLNSAGAVQWIRTPTGYTTDTGVFTGSNFAYDLVINGDELVAATQVTNEIWGSIAVNRPANHRSDAAIMRLNKATGEPVAVYDVMGIAGYDDAFTAVAIDNNGNYVTGGYFHYNLFSATDDNIPTVTKVMNQDSFTDFFIAKLANGPCGEVSGVKDFGSNKIKVYPNPASNMVNIESDIELRSYEVLNILGQRLLKGNFSPEQNIISIENLSEGTYILNVMATDSSVFTQKIIKQ